MKLSNWTSTRRFGILKSKQRIYARFGLPRCFTLLKSPIRRADFSNISYWLITMSFSFCVIMCYQIFLVSAAASVGAKRTSTGCPAPLYLLLSEFVNTGGTIHAETEFDNIYYINILRRMYGR